MRIIFVRHGDPDYANDCLTETGRQQAAQAAERLMNRGISAIFASPQGRAQETASYTAKKLGLPVTTLDFMHEISWGGEGIPEHGHPWTLAEQMILRENYDFCREDWHVHPYFLGNAATACFDYVAAQFDGFLAGRGYRRDGRRFLCETDTDETIALFSHGGSSACVMSHLLGLPFPYFSTVMGFYFASIIVLKIPCCPGEYTFPRLEWFEERYAET